MATILLDTPSECCSPAISIGSQDTPAKGSPAKDILVEVFRDGKLLVDQTFEATHPRVASHSRRPYIPLPHTR